MTGRADAPWSPDPEAEEGLKRRLGENIRLLRARIFISQEELASRADLHRTQISLLESGRQQPLIGTVLRLAVALEVDVRTLLDGIVYRPRFFSAERGRFEISPRPLFDVGAPTDRPEGGV
jgi:transcriptional regulator with XRE-family HTH domain